MQNTFVVVFENGSDEQNHILAEIFYKLTKNNAPVKALFVSVRKPEKGIRNYIANNECLCIRPKVFLFKESEVQKYLALNNETFSKEEINEIWENSGGWIKVLENMRSLRNWNITIGEIKESMERAIKDNFTKQQILSMQKIAILDEFELDQVYYLTKDKSMTTKIMFMVDDGFFFREGKGKDTYVFIAIFKKILLQKLQSSKINKEELYNRNIQWMIHKERCLEALSYSYRRNNYDTIITILVQHPNTMYCDLNPDLMEKIYDHFPPDKLIQYPYVQLQMIMDYILLLDPMKGFLLKEKLRENMDLYKDAQREIEGELYLIEGYTSYNDLHSMCANFKKAYECLSPGTSKLSTSEMVVSFGSPNVLYLYLTQKDCSALLQFIQEEIHIYTAITKGLNCALDIQARAEYALEMGDYAKSRELAVVAYHTAKEKHIHYMSVSALFTLGRGSIILHDDEYYKKVISLLKAEKKASINIILTNEIVSAMAYLLSLKPLDEEPLENILNPAADTESFDELHHSFSYIAQGQIFLNEKKYQDLYLLALKMDMFYQNHKHLYGTMYTYLYKAISTYHLGKKESSLEAINPLLALCEEVGFHTLLVEQGMNLYPLLQVLSPTIYIKNLKRSIIGLLRYQFFNFTPKEEAIFYYQKKGYSRKRIADELGISLYAVKYYIGNIRRKTRESHQGLTLI